MKDGAALGGGSGGEMQAEMQRLNEKGRQALMAERIDGGAGSQANPVLIASVIRLLSEKVAK